ncbi:MAG: hypothetical protein L0312_19105, partial [Acidobacteria bacterium]|nr:hypothetical protein [Acidobacteriota bacterium]
GDESEELGSTSIAISLRILEKCQQALWQRGKNLKFRALYVERNKPAFSRLERYLKEREQTAIEARAMKGDFVKLQQEILTWCGNGSTDWFPGDLQRALGNLIAAGKARNLDAPGKRRTKFVHVEKGERLQLVEES